MRAAILLMPLLAMACSRTSNSFEVHAPGAASAELQLCGMTSSLDHSGEMLTATRAITCEGEGSIIVHFPHRPSVSCHIGYVTPGMEMTLRFKIDGDRCD